MHLKINHGSDWEGWVKVYKQGGKGPMDIISSAHHYSWSNFHLIQLCTEAISADLSLQINCLLFAKLS